jgi:hypothetical protein
MSNEGVGTDDFPNQYPIANASELDAAIQAAKTPAHRQHVRSRARTLGVPEHRLPSHWSDDEDDRGVTGSRGNR